ncbi:hypothetical protein POSPLADRAFT_1032988 [Postia placenta MAD-698-R-SB12]|uniref:Uncharacterized protein n=1 Tax=Postia placenta MAD-698-R-SB12 TaxID=670580 RepID=A0A1X6N4E6_9APHY|nr:hypothetical protein POSPLADRAFT_1032988 [Postia placenta MAD-698-R-SB12]OSX63322.1 hypothetical protein POSPLADRAFT_1032988 [Postia placenta MAD-698-R-SB12]
MDAESHIPSVLRFGLDDELDMPRGTRSERKSDGGLIGVSTTTRGSTCSIATEDEESRGAIARRTGTRRDRSRFAGPCSSTNGTKQIAALRLHHGEPQKKLQTVGSRKLVQPPTAEDTGGASNGRRNTIAFDSPHAEMYNINGVALGILATSRALRDPSLCTNAETWSCTCQPYDKIRTDHMNWQERHRKDVRGTFVASSASEMSDDIAALSQIPPYEYSPLLPFTAAAADIARSSMCARPDSIRAQPRKDFRGVTRLFSGTMPRRGSLVQVVDQDSRPFEECTLNHERETPLSMYKHSGVQTYRYSVTHPSPSTNSTTAAVPTGSPMLMVPNAIGFASRRDARRPERYPNADPSVVGDATENEGKQIASDILELKRRILGQAKKQDRDSVLL